MSRGTTLSCAVGALANGATARIVVTVAVPPNHPGGTLTNQVQVSTSANDPDLSNNRDDASTNVVVVAPGGGGPGGELPPTGAPTGGLLLLAAILIGNGLVVTVLARKRHRTA